MEAPALAMADEALEITRWDEEDLDILAFELWRRASCPEADNDLTSWVGPEQRCYAGCL